jgi:hypothetical protein
MPVMAYSPLAGPGASLLGDPTLARIGAARGCSAAAVAYVIAIPKSGLTAHVKENAVALTLTLTPQELQTLDAAVSAPPLDAVPNSQRDSFWVKSRDGIGGPLMSALPPIADIAECDCDARFVPKADIEARSNVLGGSTLCSSKGGGGTDGRRQHPIQHNWAGHALRLLCG